MPQKCNKIWYNISRNMLILLHFWRFIMEKITRKEKREKLEEINFFEEFIKIKKHFFKDINSKLKGVNDKRNQSYIAYSTDILLFTLIMKNVSGIKSMNKMTREFNKEECINNISKALGYTDLEELPHYDTINNFLKILGNEEIENIRDYMIKQLFKKRCLEQYRLLDKYWIIAVDGTGIATFHEKHCEHCLKREYKNKDSGEVEETVYFHSVLEAKLILGDMVFSIGTEFIENENEIYDKQDCEIKAFKRLAARMKEKYPRLPVCLLGDNLYAVEPVFQTCKKYNWKYIFRFKEGRTKSLWADYESLKEIEKNEIKEYTWINEISYKESIVNIVEASIIEKKELKYFIYITDLKISEKKVERIFAAGRSRWKIENKGFNNQKNGRYDIEHACSLDYNAMKNHYLIVQISDILVQLFERGAGLIKDLNAGIKEISSRLLDSFRRDIITVEDIYELRKRIKIRLQ
jgi:hypothetical protein